MNIRKADHDDVDILVATIRASFKTVADKFDLNEENCPKHPSNCIDEWITTALDRGISYYLLEKGNKIIGCVALEKANDEECYLERLAVLKEYRNSGLGRALVDHALAEAKLTGCQRVGIGIIAEQIDLKNWYAGIGFVEGETKTFEHLPFKVTFMSYPLPK